MEKLKIMLVKLKISNTNSVMPIATCGKPSHSQAVTRASEVKAMAVAMFTSSSTAPTKTNPHQASHPSKRKTT
jgi:hypothetical protein